MSAPKDVTLYLYEANQDNQPPLWYVVEHVDLSDIVTLQSHNDPEDFEDDTDGYFVKLTNTVASGNQELYGITGGLILWVSSIEGMVMVSRYHLLWLKERDDRKAYDAFVNYFKAKFHRTLHLFGNELQETYRHIDNFKITINSIIAEQELEEQFNKMLKSPEE